MLTTSRAYRLVVLVDDAGQIGRVEISLLNITADAKHDAGSKLALVLKPSGQRGEELSAGLDRQRPRGGHHRIKLSVV